MGRDKILLRGLRLFGRHGVLPAEKTLGQPFVVDVEVHTDASKAGRTDNVEHAVDYRRIFEVARRVVEGEPLNLVESVATRIAGGVLQNTRSADAVVVRVVKPHVAFPAHLGDAGVEIFRTRADLPTLQSLHIPRK